MKSHSLAFVALISLLIFFAGGFFVLILLKGSQMSLMYMNNPSDIAVLVGYAGLFFSIAIPALFLYALARLEIFMCHWESQRRTHETKPDSGGTGGGDRPC